MNVKALRRGRSVRMCGAAGLMIAAFLAASAAQASVIGEKIDGALVFQFRAENEYDPANGDVPAYAGNAAGTLVTIDGAYDFGFSSVIDKGFNEVAANFVPSGSDTILELGAQSANHQGGMLGWEQRFTSATPGLFNTVTLLSSDFVDLSWKLDGDTIVLNWGGYSGKEDARFAAEFIVTNGTGNPPPIDPPPIAGVPEPASWALMILGLGGVGAMLRRGRGAARVLPILLGATMIAGAADAATVNFAYRYQGVDTATGSFSYADGKTGVLGYDDLSAFHVTLLGVTYDLADTTALTNYRYFAYDTATNQFIANPNACGSHGCGFKETLGATDDLPNKGFYFNVADSGFSEYSTHQSGGFDQIVLERVMDAVPEPASWALMILGFGGVGAVLRRRHLASALRT